jgi:hypothetical protein
LQHVTVSLIGALEPLDIKSIFSFKKSSSNN